MMKHNSDHHRNNNKVFNSTKLVSKETSAANSSCRVYYGAAAGAVPFMWESQPGTPKHTLSEDSLPPLTPPPSYSVNPKPTRSSSRSGARAKALLDYIIPRSLKSRTKAARNMSPTSSSVSWSSSSSSSWSSTSSKGTQKRYNSVSRVPFGYDDEDEDEDVRRSGSSPTSILCFGIKRRDSEYLRSCKSVRKIKFGFMSIARHDQSRRD